MVRWRIVLCLMAVMPAAAPAQDLDYGSIDGFYVPHASVDTRGPGAAAIDDEGAGFGLRVLSRVTDRLMVTAEYQGRSYDDSGLDTAQYRVGAGLALASTTGVFLTYDRLDLDAQDANGFGLHGRVAGRAGQSLSLYGDLAYLGVDAETFYYDGFELTLGAAWDLPAPWGLFADYRATRLDDRDNADRWHHRELRLGLRFRFDC
jgi:hypothetical protein